MKCQLTIEKNLKDLVRHEEVLRNLTTKFNWCDYCMHNNINNNKNNNDENGQCTNMCGRRYIHFAVEYTREF